VGADQHSNCPALYVQSQLWQECSNRNAVVFGLVKELGVECASRAQHCATTVPTCKLPSAGGDVCSALQDDVDGDLSWYIKGHQIALDIARGLFFLHSHGVRHLLPTPTHLTDLQLKLERQHCP
jgi:hypothetical protein